MKNQEAVNMLLDTIQKSVTADESTFIKVQPGKEIPNNDALVRALSILSPKGYLWHKVSEGAFITKDKEILNVFKKQWDEKVKTDYEKRKETFITKKVKLTLNGVDWHMIEWIANHTGSSKESVLNKCMNNGISWAYDCARKIDSYDMEGHELIMEGHELTSDDY